MMRLLMFLALAAHAEPLSYVCKRAAGPVKIDGKLDDAAWRAAAWTAEFVDIEGDRKPKPRFRTRAKMTWDDTYFYVGAEMEEPHVWGTLTEHDDTTVAVTTSGADADWAPAIAGARIKAATSDARSIYPS